MKNFLKKYSYLMVKIFIAQCVIGLFGNVLALAGVKSESNALTIAISVFAIIFYLFLVYLFAWEAGNKDKAAIDGERLKYSPLTGLYIAIGANVPNYLLTLIYAMLLPVASKVEGTASAICGISKIFLLFFNGMYTGIMSAISFGGNAMHTFWLSYLIITVPALLITALAYIMGVKEIYLTKAMVPVNPEELEIKRDKKNNLK